MTGAGAVPCKDFLFFLFWKLGRFCTKITARYRREAYCLATLLEIGGIDPDINKIEGTNRTMVFARDDEEREGGRGEQ